MVAIWHFASFPGRGLGMLLRITDACIACSACQGVCPAQAVLRVQGRYQIDPQSCDGCDSVQSDPYCILVCPTACIESVRELAMSA